MDWSEKLKWIAGIVGALAVVVPFLWRYFATPLISVYEHSKAIADALPALLELSQPWLLDSSDGSLREYLTELEEKLEDVNAVLHAHLDQSSLPIYRCSVNGDCTYANDALCEMFGLSLAEMLGSGWLEGIAYEDRMRAHNNWKAFVQANIPYNCEYRVVNCRTGVRTRGSTKAIPLYSAKQKLLGFYGVFYNTSPVGSNMTFLVGKRNV